MTESAYTKLLDSIGDDLIQTIKADIAAHMASIADAVPTLYGYAIQTPDYTSLDQPIVVYNCEQDLDEEHQDDVYYRYSVDEWQHYEGDALPKTTALTSVYDQQFSELSADNDALDGEEFRRRIYDAFTEALWQLKNERLFPADAFLVVWPREEEIILASAKRLNSEEVFEAVESEFG